MTAPGVRLVILGRQGAGKGTQCARLATHYGVPHISTGDMLRAAVKEGTSFGLKAKEYMDAGNLLPDDVMIGIVEERLGADDAVRGFLLDGFPRTPGQAKALDELTVRLGMPLDAAIDLEVAEDVVLERISGRRVCSSCGATYSVDAPPKSGWTCDVCGGDVVQRDDDTPEAVRKRLDLYNEQTAPLVSYYREAGLLHVVDGLGAPDEVGERLIATIESTR